MKRSDLKDFLSLRNIRTHARRWSQDTRAASKDVKLDQTLAEKSTNSSFGAFRPSDPYACAPLDPDTRSIRLLTFDEHKSTTSSIHCELATFALDEAPEFVALSYAWGEESDPTNTIRLNGLDFVVRRNLWRFLTQMCVVLRTRRSGCVCDTAYGPSPNDDCHLGHILETSFTKGSIYLWIDALCINQRRPHEQNHQVSLMGSIYSQATKVIVWLKDQDNIIAQYAGTVFNLLKDGQTFDRRKMHGTGKLQTILRSKYWTRRWIIQEIVRAKHVVLLHGNYWIDLQCFEAGCKKLTPDTGFGYEALVAWGHVSDIMSLRQSSPNELSLATILCMFEDSQCQVRKDCVYALIGILEGTPAFRQCPIPVEYQQSDESFLQTVMDHLLTTIDPDGDPLARWYAARAVDWVAHAMNIQCVEVCRLLKASVPNGPAVLRELESHYAVESTA